MRSDFSLNLGLEVIDLLANLGITPGDHADEPAMQKAQVWAAIEDEEDVAEAMRLDETEDAEELESSDEEEDDIDDVCPGGGGADEPSYAELSLHFGALENYASGCRLTEACNLLKDGDHRSARLQASSPG